MKTQTKLCLLDLDHTLIYGSYAPSEEAELLFQYSQYLKIYKRPYVDEFVKYLQKYFSDIIVYTTAKKDYAEKICEYLNINPTELLSRLDCKEIDDRFYKTVKKDWVDSYDKISIIDDSPNVWVIENNSDEKIKFFIPKEFRGSSRDKELGNIIELING
ncbi:HAD family hydrolase [Bacteroidia bacterium]|nr:HAD family hydrolase [Bacteroidia bacterium]